MSLQISVDSSAVMSGMSSLYVHQELTDIRLVCADGSLIAHKVVLAAVSHKLKEMMVSSDTTIQASNTAVVSLTDIAIEDIQTIVDCIYFGQKTIESKRFEGLTRIADNFGIKLSSAVSAAFASSHVLPSVLSDVCSDPKPILLSATGFDKKSRWFSGLSISKDILTDCYVCGESHSTHKQLIQHLNKEHKTNDCFKCSGCGKEEKDPETFAFHFILGHKALL